MDKQVCFTYRNFTVASLLGALMGSAVLLLVHYFFCSNHEIETTSIASCIISVLSFVMSIWAFVFKRKSFKQERFETTFFNLLEYKKKTINSVSFKCEDLGDCCFLEHQYDGEEAWKRVCKELKMIKDCLLSSGYLEPLDDCRAYKEIQGHMRASIETTESEVKFCYCSRANYTYKITKEIFYESKQDSSNDAILKRVFHLLVERKLFFNEHYLRLIQLIFSLLKIVDNNMYAKVLLSQMSKYELQVLYCQSLVDTDFKKMMNLAGIEVLFKNDFKCII